MISREAIVKIFFPLSKGIWEYFVSPLIEFVAQFSTLHVSSSIGRILVQVCTTQINESSTPLMSWFNSNRWVCSTQITWVINSNRWVCLTQIHMSFYTQITWVCSTHTAWVQLWDYTKSHASFKYYSKANHLTKWSSLRKRSVVTWLFQIVIYTTNHCYHVRWKIEVHFIS
jgi:hypothetical protein